MSLSLLIKFIRYASKSSSFSGAISVLERLLIAVFASLNPFTIVENLIFSASSINLIIAGTPSNCSINLVCSSRSIPDIVLKKSINRFNDSSFCARSDRIFGSPKMLSIIPLPPRDGSFITESSPKDSISGRNLSYALY